MLDSADRAHPDASPQEIRARFKAIIARIGAAPLSEREEQHVYRALWALWCGIPTDLETPGDEDVPPSQAEASHSRQLDWTIGGHLL